MQDSDGKSKSDSTATDYPSLPRMGVFPATAHQPCGGEVNEEPHYAVFRARLEPAGTAGAVNRQFSLRRLADGWA